MVKRSVLVPKQALGRYSRRAVGETSSCPGKTGTRLVIKVQRLSSRDPTGWPKPQASPFYPLLLITFERTFPNNICRSRKILWEMIQRMRALLHFSEHLRAFNHSKLDENSIISSMVIRIIHFIRGKARERETIYVYSRYIKAGSISTWNYKAQVVCYTIRYIIRALRISIYDIYIYTIHDASNILQVFECSVAHFLRMEYEGNCTRSRA